MGVAAVRCSSSSSARCRYPDTNRAAIPSERSAAIMSTARSRQLPLASVRVRIGSRIPFSCRAAVLEGSLHSLCHVDEQVAQVS